MSRHWKERGRRKPPECPGFIYTVRPTDTLFKIARRFCVDLDRLIELNPQIDDPDLIFPGDQICIPKKVEDRIPKVEDVEFFDKKKRELPEKRNRVLLAPKTIVKATFSIPVDEAFLLFTPEQEDTELIQAVTVDEERQVKFFWKVPKGIKGVVFVIGCANQVCGRSEDIPVISKRRRRRKPYSAGEENYQDEIEIDESEYFEDDEEY
ncbi:LysM peptidoglycan-binding domain-containing protein [Natranaerobius thermophilus]|uniref:Peptidoglycan-binding LysM n=1 Tax=Natranaerobius thermophilus (strain ATCC BAA-1301 / DSM 18059 / JW/NM-WN-LF) TaxID=457570 RepID=B2A4M6_NATTJ|nr:LysM peptidoglycan-binding domain-containing protein [Natranaerobius thermophilus]ACB85201.1 Peptidoglycan-binding LysM [Natranaerobius thermophilus JW/NM-WN-LF]